MLAELSHCTSENHRTAETSIAEAGFIDTSQEVIMILAVAATVALLLAEYL